MVGGVEAGTECNDPFAASAGAATLDCDTMCFVSIRFRILFLIQRLNWVNFILLVFAFTVYKGHLISENRTKKFDYWNLFKYELKWRTDSMKEKPIFVQKFVKLAIADLC